MESTKKKRIKTIDFVRGLSVLLMIPVHTMMVFSDMNTWKNTITGNIIQMIEKGTPVFLVVMGISFAFSSKSKTKNILKKAAMIFSLGYILNFFRFLVPLFFFGGLPDDFMELSGLKAGELSSALNLFLKGDILQLAGVSLLFIGISFNFLTKNKNVLLLITLGVIWLSKIVSGFQIGIPVIDYFLSLLWGNNFDVYFPLFPWISFILIGLYFGICYLENPKNIYKSLFLRMLLVGAFFLVSGIILCNYNYKYHFGDYYHLGPGGTMGLIGFNLIAIWFGYQVVRKLPESNAISKLFFYCSKNVTPFYFIQWVLIYWTMTFIGFSIHKEFAVLFIMVLLTVATFLFVHLYNNCITLIKKRKANKIAQQLA